MIHRNTLIDLIKQHALKYGEFKLSSGAQSKYYIDLSKVLTRPPAMVAAAACLSQVLAEEAGPNYPDDCYEAVGGPLVGAVPLVDSFLLHRSLCGPTATFNKHGFYVRDARKEHGDKDLIEGVLNEGDRVILLEDVATTAGSILRAIKPIEARGAKIALVIALLDREQGATEAMQTAGYPYRSILKVTEILDPTKI